MKSTRHFIPLMILLLGCQGGNPPQSYSLEKPTTKTEIVFHETIGIMEGITATQALKGATNHLFATLYSKIKTNTPTNISLERQGKHLKIYLPTRLKETLQNESQNPAFTIEITVGSKRVSYPSKQITFKTSYPQLNLEEVVFLIDDATQPLASSETHHLRFPVGKREQRVISKKGVFAHAFAPYIFIIGKNGLPTKQKVKLGATFDNQIAIIEGIDSESQILIPN